MDETWTGFLRELEQVRAVAPRLSGIEVRADGDGDGPAHLTGHFSVFNVWYEINSWFEGRFLERIAPGAFKRTFNAAAAASDPHRIQVLLEHGYDPTVGDKPLGVWGELREDSTGAFYDVELFDEASYVRDLMPAFRSGVYGSSFRFRVIVDEWNDEPGVSDHNPEGIAERTIREMRVFEFGPTVFPASPTATAGLRSQTDEFYQRLRSRDPKAYDDLLARSRELRTPDDGPAGDGTPDEGLATITEDSPERHSEVDTPAARMQARRRERLQARGLWTPTQEEPAA